MIALSSPGLGGGKRQCLINDETEFEKQKMRNSGDLVRIDDRGDMYYVGRDVDQIKRMGKRVNLIELEKVGYSSCYRFLPCDINVN